MVLPLLIHIPQTSVISCEPCSKLKSGRVTIQQAKVIFRRRFFFILGFKPLHYRNAIRVNIFVVSLAEVELCNSVHSTLCFIPSISRYLLGIRLSLYLLRDSWHYGHMIFTYTLLDCYVTINLVVTPSSIDTFSKSSFGSTILYNTQP